MVENGASTQTATSKIRRTPLGKSCDYITEGHAVAARAADGIVPEKNDGSKLLPSHVSCL